jgi:hypothetical protein
MFRYVLRCAAACVVLVLLFYATRGGGGVETFASAASKPSPPPPPLAGCRYLKHNRATPVGNFVHTVRNAAGGSSSSAAETCDSIAARYGTESYNLYVGTTAELCLNRPEPLAKKDKIAVYPNHKCVFVTPSYDTSCSEVAEAYNTTASRIRYNPTPFTTPAYTTCAAAAANQPTQPIPRASTVQVCPDPTLNASAILPPASGNGGGGGGGSLPVGTSRAGCRQTCDQEPGCAAILYGDGDCKLLRRSSPLANVAGSGKHTDMYSCTPTKPLVYGGATNAVFGLPASSTVSLGNTCALGDGGGGGSSRICQGAADLPPYTYAPAAAHASCKVSWRDVIRKNPVAMKTHQGDFTESAFLNQMCGGGGSGGSMV